VKSIADYDNEIQQDPNNAELYRLRGIEYYQKDDYDRAMIDFDRANKLNPSCAKTYNCRGMAYKQKGDLDRAIKEFDQAIQFDPNLVRAYINRGNAFELKDDPERALADYTKAIQIDPKNADGYINRGGIYSSFGAAYLYGLNDINQGNAFFDQAISDFYQAIQIDSNNAMVYVYRGMAYKAKKDFDKAIIDFDQAIKINPNYADAYYQRGEAYHKKEIFDQAIADYNQTIKLDTNHALAYSHRAYSYFDLGDYAQAIADWEIVLRLNPDDSAAKMNIEKARGKVKAEYEYHEAGKREQQRIESERRYKRKEELKKTTGLLLQFGILFIFLCLLWGTELIYSIRNSVFWNIMLPAVLSLALGIISRLFLQDSRPKLPWGTVSLIFGLVATTVTANVWMGGSIAGGIILVILALIPITLVYFMWADWSNSIGGNIGLTILAVVITAIAGGIISSISDNGSIFIFIFLVIPAIPGMIIMHKTEDANW